MSRLVRLKKGDRVKFRHGRDPDFWCNGNIYYVVGFECAKCQAMVWLSDKKKGRVILFALRDWRQNDIIKMPRRKS